MALIGCVISVPEGHRGVSTFLPVPDKVIGEGSARRGPVVRHGACPQNGTEEPSEAETQRKDGKGDVEKHHVDRAGVRESNVDVEI
ncbi:MAG: hypothetical protein M1837_002019 [Sclerophora amabilis]|nr:MAG: hypothetical protein M1837_002019 [Sclerophora amabilis]